MSATNPGTTGTVEIRRAGTRDHTDIGWLDSWHSFSFGGHYDPGNVGHGDLIVLNDDTVRAGGGFGAHPHRDMEIVTWVLSGEVAHQDSTGTSDVIYPGLAQRMSAGRGITHSEMNASKAVDTHFVQMWVQPDVTGIEPSYEQRDLNEALARGGLVPVASGRGHEGSVLLHQKGAVLWVGRLQPGERVAVPEAPFVHVFMAIGEGTLGTDELRTGDAARLTGATGLSLTAGADRAEVLIWETT